MINVNDSYFEGYYKDVWRAIIPPAFTAKEVEFLINYFSLSRNSQVLDLMSGFGRHSIPLARLGIQVIAVDNLAHYTDEIQAIALSETLPLTVVNSSALSFKLPNQVDFAMIMGNSLNFFPKKQMQVILSNVAKGLKPAGQVIINTWSLTEISARHFASQNSYKVGEIQFTAESEYKFNPTRIETKTTMIPDEGNAEEKFAVDYILSVAEVIELLGNSGLTVENIFSHPGKKQTFEIGDERAYIIARRRAD